MRYFLYGYYGFGNFGDDLLLEALLSRLRQQDPQARFTVRSRSVPQGLQADDVTYTCSETLLEQAGGRVPKAWRYLRTMRPHVLAADVIVVGGGTLFIDKGRFNASLFLLWSLLWLARRHGKRIAIVGVAVDTLTHPVSLWLTKQIFALADFVAVRDALSLPYVAHCAAGVARQSADLVYTLPVPEMGHKETGERRKLGLCFIDYFGVNEINPALRARYRDRILAWVDQHSESLDLCWIAFQKEIGLREDWLLADAEAAGIRLPVHYVADVSNASRLLQDLDGVISTRFHLGLLCAMTGTPCVVIEHELKMNALAQELYLPSLGMMQFVEDDSADLLALLAAQDLSATENAVQVQRIRAEHNFDWLPA